MYSRGKKELILTFWLVWVWHVETYLNLVKIPRGNPELSDQSICHKIGLEWKIKESQTQEKHLTSFRNTAVLLSDNALARFFYQQYFQEESIYHFYNLQRLSRKIIHLYVPDFVKRQKKKKKSIIVHQLSQHLVVLKILPKAMKNCFDCFCR